MYLCDMYRCLRWPADGRTVDHCVSIQCRPASHRGHKSDTLLVISMAALQGAVPLVPVKNLRISAVTGHRTRISTLSLSPSLPLALWTTRIRTPSFSTVDTHTTFIIGHFIPKREVTISTAQQDTHSHFGMSYNHRRHEMLRRLGVEQLPTLEQTSSNSSDVSAMLEQTITWDDPSPHFHDLSIRERPVSPASSMKHQRDV